MRKQKGLPKIGDTVKYSNGKILRVGFVCYKDSIYCNIEHPDGEWIGPIYTAEGYVSGRAVLTEKFIKQKRRKRIYAGF